MIHFRALYRAPDQFALYLCDEVDKTPILCFINRNTLIYDAVRPAVIFYEGCSPQFSIECHPGNQLRYQWRFSGGADAPPSNFTVDIRSFFQTPGKSDEVVASGENGFRITRTSSRDILVLTYGADWVNKNLPPASGTGGKLVCDVDASKTCPYTRLQILKDDQKNPLFSIDKCVVNESIADEEFKLPDVRQIENSLTIMRLPAESALANAEGLVIMLRAQLVRLAARNTEMRIGLKLPGVPLIEGQTKLEIDWDNVARNDEKYSKALREYLGARSSYLK